MSEMGNIKTYIFTSANGGYVFGCVCMLVPQQDYLESNEPIYRKLLPEVCLWPKKNPLNFVDDSGYDPHPGSRL